MVELSELSERLDALKRRHGEVVLLRAAAVADLDRLTAARGAVLLSGPKKAADENGRQLADAQQRAADADAMLTVLETQLEAAARAVWQGEYDASLARVVELETVRLPAAVAEKARRWDDYTAAANAENVVRVEMFTLIGGGATFKARRAELLAGVQFQTGGAK